MNNNPIENAIRVFLDCELELDIEKELKKKADGQAKAEATQKRRDTLYQKMKDDYEYNSWLTKVFDSLNEMQKHQLSLATHTAKGIHSSLRTENVCFFTSKQLPVGLVGTQSITNLEIDANSNNSGKHAGFLKHIVAFLNIAVQDTKIHQLIKSNHLDVLDYFKAYDQEDGFNYLKNLLNKSPTGEQTDGRHKQLLYHLQNDDYVCLIPLYPSALAYQVYQYVNNIKHSPENVEARKTRKSKENPKAYKDMPNLATVILGGTNSNNVSRLNNMQGGRNYLLPSLPPKISPHQTVALSKFSENFFDSKVLAYKTQRDFEFVAEVIDHARNRVDIRNQRKDAIDRILHTIFSMAHQLQSQPAGWSKDYALPLAQKIWLDPHRATLAGEEDFARHKAEDDWQEQIIDDFARWLNHTLKQRFDKIRHQFADSEFYEWQKEIETMIDTYKRQGKGVFL